LAEVIDHLLARPLAGVRIACQRDGSDVDEAAIALRRAGADVVEVATYRWLRPEDEVPANRLLEAVCNRTVDAVTFTSPPAIENLFAMAEERGQVAALRAACSKGVLPVCVGPVTREAALANGLSAAVAPTRSLLGAMVNTVVDELGGRRLVVPLAAGELVLTGAVATVHGERVELTAREAAVLTALAKGAGTVVSKPAILRAVWGDADADPHALEVTVSRLRRQHGPAGDAVQTVVRRGYPLRTAP
jgi:uroporphyrinogen-III synthase